MSDGAKLIIIGMALTALVFISTIGAAAYVGLERIKHSCPTTISGASQ